MLIDIFSAAVRRVEPGRLVAENLRPGRVTDLAGPEASANDIIFTNYSNIIIISFGKASFSMAESAASRLGSRALSGVVVVPHGTARPLDGFQVIEAGHPVPDPGSLRAADAILTLAGQAGFGDMVLCLISGGGSALVEKPADGLELADLQQASRALLRCGAEIQEVNCIRKHLSAIKGGRLAQAVHPARLVGLVLSDVVGDPLDMIASGPTVPDPTTFSQALEIIKKYNVQGSLGRKPCQHLEAGAAGLRPETPKPGDPIFARVTHRIVGSAALATAAACTRARELGLRPHLLTSRLTGEAREVARSLAGLANDIARRAHALVPPILVVAGGETTVTVRGRGRGGRNQELALAFLDVIGDEAAPLRPISLLSAGTDGIDGPTDAAGAVVTPDLWARIRREGLDPKPSLAENDAYSFFDQAGGLLRTGPTGTNVGDLLLLLIE